VAACIRWLRQRDAARTLAPPLNGHPRELRASREERREILRSLWIPLAYIVPWSHAHIEPLDRFEKGLGIDASPGEVLDLMALGLPILPSADGNPLCRVSLPHACLWREHLAALVGYSGGDESSPFLGREMRRLCGWTPFDDD
jgi:hypothetical protein